MPIVHFINSKQKQTSGGMKCVLGYVGKEKKTVREDRKYVTGINCSPQTAYDEMMLTKKVHRKTGGRLYYHLVQSFPKGYDITPEKAHQIAVEFAQRAFGQYECVVATHIDREHIHSHIVFNSVSFDTGKKYHSDKENPLKLMNLSDEICKKYNEPVLADPEPKVEGNWYVLDTQGHTFLDNTCHWCKRLFDGNDQDLPPYDEWIWYPYDQHGEYRCWTVEPVG